MKAFEQSLQIVKALPLFFATVSFTFHRSSATQIQTFDNNHMHKLFKLILPLFDIIFQRFEFLIATH